MVEVEAAVATVTEMEAGERAEARVREAPVQGMDEPEVLQGCGCVMKCICSPCTFRTGGDGALHVPGPRSFQKLAHIRTVLGELGM